MNDYEKNSYKVLFEVEEPACKPCLEQLAIVDGVEQDSGVWQLWARFQRGYAIARTRLDVGQTVYALYWNKTGYWAYTGYKVTCIKISDECTLETMGQCKDYIIVTNKYGKDRKVPLYALGYSVLTTAKYAQRAAAIKNAEDFDKVLLGRTYTRLANY